MKVHWKRVQRWGYGLGLVILCAAAIVFTVRRARAQAVPDPVLAITLLGTNQVQLTILNGVSTANYEVRRRSFLDPAHSWLPPLMGSQGQTNFTVSLGLETMGFFGAITGPDWDGDGVPNWQDGNPVSPGIGALSITIDGPAPGAILH
jgi:hypothetical protein